MKSQVLSIIGRHKQGHRPSLPCRNMLVSIQTEVEALKDPWVELRKSVNERYDSLMKQAHSLHSEGEHDAASSREKAARELTMLLAEMSRLEATGGKR